MSKSFQTISFSDLTSFLNDLERGVENKDDADYRKLVIFLLGFLNSRLLDVLSNDPVFSRSNNISIINRILSCFELILTKERNLLNSLITQKEADTIINPNDGGINTTSNCLLYEWGINFAIEYLKKSIYDEQVSFHLKSFIILIINLITTKLHVFKHRFKLRQYLTCRFEDLLDATLANLGSDFSQISTLVHLFTIVNDYDIRLKLGSLSGNSDFKLELYGRKLWFVLNSIDLNVIPTETFKLVDNLKAITIINISDSLIINETVCFAQLTLILNWMVEYIHQLDDGTVPLSKFNKQQITLNRSIGYSLLKLYIFGLERKLEFQLITTMNLDKLYLEVSQYHEFPEVILQTLKVISYHHAQLSHSELLLPSDIKITPFQDNDMEELRTRLSMFHKSNSSLLSFIVPDNLSYEFYNDPSMNYENWLDYVKSLIKNNQEVFDQKEVLFTFINSIGNFSCLLSGNYDFEVGECRNCVGTYPMKKTSNFSISPNRKLVNESTIMYSFYKSIIIEFLLKLKLNVIKMDHLLTSALLLTIYKLFASYRPKVPDDTDIIFKFIMDNLSKNENREIRLLAARIMPLYLIAPMNEDLEQTFRLIFGRISMIDFGSENGKIYLGESTIYALGELAKVSQGEFLCALFIKLIDMFGENNEQHVNLVYCTLLDVASSKSVTPYKLLSPFLPSIAERIVKQPRMLLRITELLGVSKKYFLSRTKEYTTPRLLEYYKYDFIQEIADASGMTKRQLITKNLPRIIATYLCKGTNINEKYILGVLGNASPDYKGIKMKDIMFNIGGITWYILLQIQYDGNGNISNEDQIMRALDYVGRVNHSKNYGKNKQDHNFDYIKNLLGDHVLELVQRFSENIHQIRGTKPYLEKVSSLKAIEFLIEKNIGAASTALGQISTCLQATLENVEFQLAAINCWKVLIVNLDTNHLVSLFDIIISIIFQKFKEFEHRSKVTAVEILKILFQELRDKYTKYSLYFFSVPFVEALDEYYKLDHTLRAFMRQKSKFNYLPEFTRRLQTGNNYVVQQALADLVNFTTKYQRIFQSDDFKDTTISKDVSILVRTLLDTARINRGKNSSISKLCAKALSLIGALDPNKFPFMSMKKQIIVIHDFGDYQENCEFLRHFMEEIVIKAFWASDNPVKQLFSAFSMQKFLQVLMLDHRILNPTTQDGFSEVWNQFSDIAKSTLTPLLSSKYVSPTSKYQPLNFPYYKVNMHHEKWLVDLTSNLLKRSARIDDEKSSKSIIFETCSMLVRDQDISMCNYLLKYVCLSLVVNGDSTSFDDIKNEFLYIIHLSTAQLPPDRSESLIGCFQSIFEVLDYFNEWYSVATEYHSEHQSSKIEIQRLAEKLQLVKNFLEEIPMTLIAVKSAECDSFERTILYLENCYRDMSTNDSLAVGNLKIIPTLQKMYSNINDFDSLGGIIKKFSTNNLTEKLKTFQYSEDWSLAQESFKALSQPTRDSMNYSNTKLLNSLQDHALYEDILSNLNSKINFDVLTNIPIEWCMAGLEASIGSGNLTELEKWLYVTETISDKLEDKESSINYQFSKGLYFLAQNKKGEYERCMESAYETIGGSLASSLSSSFSRNISLMIRLHIMYDLNLLISTATNRDESSKLEIEAILQDRLNNVDQGFETQGQLLSTHYIAYKILKDEPKIANILLQFSRTARANNRLDISTKCIVKAMALDEKDANVEYCDLLWDQGKHAEAIKSLGSILEDAQFKTVQQKSKAQLQYAIWLDESNHSSSSTIIKEYTKSFKIENTWDKPYYELGKYYSKIMESQVKSTGVYEQQTIRYFLKALALGPGFIFEALPKLITVWLDFAQKLNHSKDSERILNQIVADIKTSITTIPIYVWYTSLTQILSRIGHQHEASSNLLIQIISMLIQTYPRHSLWFALSHLKSKDLVRQERVSKAISKAQQSKASLSEEVSNAKLIFTSLKKIADLKISKRSTRKMSLFKDFDVPVLSEPCRSLVIPVRSNLEIRLPNTKHTPKSFTAFPRTAAVTFDGFDKVVNIFHSLQMPRQLTIRGSDGNVYRLMIKKDDTRKDAKVVEITTMINRLLSTSNETRKRNLYISNYSVVPLAENSGVIEYVQDVATMKSVINDQRKRLGGSINERKLFMQLDSAQKASKSKAGIDDSTSTLVEVFQEICRKTPPVLHQWYIHQFSDPGSWYQARTLFTRSAAVMSIVGYIIGLGDRHCENILFFKKSGGILHIDFDCLFDKGQTLPIPEIVPFRLTQNMIDAMGITGIEGSFRITCEVTASLLRDNEASLMNILETLLYDPLLDWKSHSNPEGHLRKVRRKIRGLLDEKEGLPMNVHGQVDVLIQESSSAESLSQMYGGWAPYI